MTNEATAISLMRMALPLLDKASHGVAACHLEQAIFVATECKGVIAEAVINNIDTSEIE